MSRLKQTIYQLFYGDMLCRLLPIRKNRFLFSSFFGQHYSDGPRAISERLHARYPEAEIWWDFSEPDGREIPDYIRVVDRNSPRYFRVKATAAFQISNVFQQGGYLTGDSRRNAMIRLHLWLENRRKQGTLTTWHGTPIKRMQADQVGGKARPFLCNSPCYYLVGNAFEEEVLTRLTQNRMIPLRFGSVRTVNAKNVPDSLIRGRKLALGLDPETHVVLYAPTFRDGSKSRERDTEASGLSQIQSLDPDRLFSVLRTRFGWEKTVLLCRFHNQVERAVDWKTVGADGRILSGNVLEDIMDYYQISDLVITDYSSVMFDFMITEKPVLLLCPDYEHYRDAERGLYFTPEELPFPFATDWEGLYEALRNFDEADYLRRLHALTERMGYYGDDGVLDRAADFLMGKER